MAGGSVQGIQGVGIGLQIFLGHHIFFGQLWLMVSKILSFLLFWLFQNGIPCAICMEGFIASVTILYKMLNSKIDLLMLFLWSFSIFNHEEQISVTELRALFHQYNSHLHFSPSILTFNPHLHLTSSVQSSPSKSLKYNKKSMKFHDKTNLTNFCKHWFGHTVLL